MNSMEDYSKLQTSDNMPVFFTGLTETVNNETKLPSVCILCKNTVSSKFKNNDSLKNSQTHNGCENCARNFNIIKEALSSLSKISSLPPVPIPEKPPSEICATTKITEHCNTSNVLISK